MLETSVMTNEQRLAAARRAAAAVGSQAKLARLLSVRSGVTVTPGRVGKWCTKIGVPAGWVPMVAEVSGVPMAELHPQAFGRVA